MYPLAVNAGIDATEYWSMTLEEIIVQSQGIKEHHMRELKERAVMDHKLSQLMAFAFNEPNKMPDVDKMYGFLDEADEIGEQPEPMEDWQKDRLEFMKQAELIRATNNAKKGGE